MTWRTANSSQSSTTTQINRRLNCCSSMPNNDTDLYMPPESTPKQQQQSLINLDSAKTAVIPQSQQDSRNRMQKWEFLYLFKVLFFGVRNLQLSRAQLRTSMRSRILSERLPCDPLTMTMEIKPHFCLQHRQKRQHWSGSNVDVGSSLTSSHFIAQQQGRESVVACNRA